MLGSTAISLLLAEAALRVLDVTPTRYRQPAHLETDDKRHGVDLYPDDPSGSFHVDLRDDALRARLIEETTLTELEARYERTPHAVPGRYSAELCRGASFGAPDPDRPRVIFIGDSFTEGQGVYEEDTFVAQLRPRFSDAELLNCGRRGYDFPRLREWLTLRLRDEPDVVIYAMVLNDPHQSDAFRARQAFLDDWILDRRRMVSEGDGSPPPWEPRLVSLLADRIEGARVGMETQRWYRDMVEAPNAEGWEHTLDDLVAMRDAAAAEGASFHVALWPLMSSLEYGYPFQDTHHTITSALEARGIDVLDTLPAFEGRATEALWVHPADHHPNAAAQRVFADAIEPMLDRALSHAALSDSEP